MLMPPPHCVQVRYVDDDVVEALDLEKEDWCLDGRRTRRASNGAQMRPPADADSSEHSVKLLASLAEYLETCGGSAEMITGWYTKTVSRKNDRKNGTPRPNPSKVSDSYFFNTQVSGSAAPSCAQPSRAQPCRSVLSAPPPPCHHVRAQGICFRSRAEVARSFNLEAVGNRGKSRVDKFNLEAVGNRGKSRVDKFKAAAAGTHRFAHVVTLSFAEAAEERRAEKLAQEEREAERHERQLWETREAERAAAAEARERAREANPSLARVDELVAELDAALKSQAKRAKAKAAKAAKVTQAATKAACAAREAEQDLKRTRTRTAHRVQSALAQPSAAPLKTIQSKDCVTSIRGTIVRVLFCLGMDESMGGVRAVERARIVSACGVLDDHDYTASPDERTRIVTPLGKETSDDL